MAGQGSDANETFIHLAAFRVVKIIGHAYHAAAVVDEAIRLIEMKLVLCGEKRDGVVKTEFHRLFSSHRDGFRKSKALQGT